MTAKGLYPRCERLQCRADNYLLVFLAIAVAGASVHAADTKDRPVLYNGDGGWHFYADTDMPDRFTREDLEPLLNRFAKAKITFHAEVF